MRLKKHPHCLNCGFKVDDFNYCPECGQPNTDRKLTLWQFIRDFFDDYFTFDSRFFHSVGPLIVRPGHLTREYLDGRRFRYILPLRLYLFTTFLFFFVLAIQAKIGTDRTYDQVKPKISAAARDSIATILEQHQGEIPPALSSYILTSLDEAQKETAAYDSSNTRIMYQDGKKSDNRIIQMIDKKARFLMSKGKEGGRMFGSEVVRQIPKIMFLLLPVFALILKLLYVRRKYLFVEHLIFALHIHTLVFLLVLIAILIPKWYVVLPMILLVFIQLFRALRSVYRQSIPKTFAKMILLTNIYGFALMVATGLLALLALAMV
ncbi:DUF3667 domain-containing protein [bacterium]|nr:DUF3667 domain-containing protein [bacterium]